MKYFKHLFEKFIDTLNRPHCMNFQNIISILTEKNVKGGGKVKISKMQI